MGQLQWIERHLALRNLADEVVVVGRTKHRLEELGVLIYYLNSTVETTANGPDADVGGKQSQKKRHTTTYSWTGCLL
jgi:hypothetical protein